MAVLGGRYELGELLGMGATGSVYKAKDIQDGKIVAVKQIVLSKMNKKQIADIMSELDLLQRFQHPNIVKIHGFIKAPKELSFILEFMDNGSLTRMMKQLGAFPEPLVAQYMSQALKGVQFLHENNIIHRDIKGDNLLISKDGRVCVADFGLATKVDVDAPPPDEPEVVGTPYWIAPEVILMTAQTTASDIWSIGCTVIELLTGNPPYSNFSAMGAIFHMVQDEHPPFPKGISKDLENFLLQCFEKEISSRATAKQLLQHPWLPSISDSQDLQKVRSSISAYNRSPTVVSSQETKTLEHAVNEALEKDRQDLEIVNKEVTQLTIGNEKTVKVTAIIEKLSVKLSFISKRILSRQTEEEALLKLSRLYGKLMRDERETYDRQLRAVQEALFVDLKMQPDLQRQIQALKASIYPTAKALADSTDPNFEYKKDDKFYVIHNETTKWLVEHTGSGKQGNIQASQLEVLPIQDKSTYAKGTEGFVEIKIPLSKDAEEVIHNIEEKSRKGKLGDFFGASKNELDKGLRESKERMPTLNLSADAVGSPKKRGVSKFISDLLASGKDDSRPLAVLLKEHPNLVQEGRDYVRDGPLGVAHSPNHKEKPKDAHVFLFSDLLVICKTGLLQKEKYQIVNQIALEDARVILVADLTAKPAFQISYNNSTYTITPMESDIMMATNTRNAWFRDLKQLVREFQKKKYHHGNPPGTTSLMNSMTSSPRASKITN